jgi:hypothetical protein
MSDFSWNITFGGKGQRPIPRETRGPVQRVNVPLLLDIQNEVERLSGTLTISLDWRQARARPVSSISGVMFKSRNLTYAGVVFGMLKTFMSTSRTGGLDGNA